MGRDWGRVLRPCLSLPGMALGVGSSLPTPPAPQPGSKQQRWPAPAEECQGHAGGQLGLGTSNHENRQLPGPDLLFSTGPVSLAVTTEDGVLWKQTIARTEVMGGPLKAKANCEERSKWGMF